MGMPQTPNFRIVLHTMSFARTLSKGLVHYYICDWLWENPPLTHEDKIRNSVIQSVLSQEGLKLQACNLL